LIPTADDELQRHSILVKVIVEIERKRDQHTVEAGGTQHGGALRAFYLSKLTSDQALQAPYSGFHTIHNPHLVSSPTNLFSHRLLHSRHACTSQQNDLDLHRRISVDQPPSSSHDGLLHLPFPISIPMQFPSVQPQRLHPRENPPHLVRPQQILPYSIAEYLLPNLSCRYNSKELPLAKKIQRRADACLEDAEDGLQGMFLELCNQGMGAIANDEEAIMLVEERKEGWEGSGAGGGSASEVNDAVGSWRWGGEVGVGCLEAVKLLILGYEAAGM